MTIGPQAAELIEALPLGFTATVTKAGEPRVSPKGTFLVLNENTLAFGNIRSPGTISNLVSNPAIEVNFIDPLKRKGYRLRGAAKIIEKDTDSFNSIIGKWHDTWGDLARRISQLVTIDVTFCKEFTTPPYDHGASEEEMIALYKAKFAGMHL